MDKEQHERMVDRAFIMSERIVRNAHRRGDVKLAQMDIKAQYGVEVDDNVACTLMAMGASLVLVAVGSGIASGALKLDKEAAEKHLQALQAEQDTALKSEDVDPADSSFTLEAERAAAEAIARIRKMH